MDKWRVTHRVSSCARDRNRIAIIFSTPLPPTLPGAIVRKRSGVRCRRRDQRLKLLRRCDPTRLYMGTYALLRENAPRACVLRIGTDVVITTYRLANRDNATLGARINCYVGTISPFEFVIDSR